MRTFHMPGVVALAALLLAATGTPSVKVSQAWVRPTPPGASTAALYALIENSAAEPDRLVSVETDVAEVAELHTVRNEDGMVVMRPVEGGIPVPARGSVRLKPGGYHIMLVRPTRQIEAGDTVQVTLVFAKAGRVTLAVPAGPPPGQPAMKGGGHGAMQGGRMQGGMQAPAPAPSR